MVPVAGSAYTYAYATLGELFAWIIGWDLILEYAVGAATVANGWSGYFQSVLAKFGLQLAGGARRPADHLRRGSGRTSSSTGRHRQSAGGHHRRARHGRPREGHPGERRASTPRWWSSSWSAVLFVICVGAFYINPPTGIRSRRTA